MEAVAIQCANKDCRIAEDGKCVEGLTPQTCPDYGKPLDLPAADDGSAEGDVWQLSPAGRLSLTDADPVLRRSATTLVAVLGPHDSGKTSLIAGLFELFQQGPIGSFRFAGSRTLHAFEIACHNARAASERLEPDSSRTPLGEVAFFHLDVVQPGDPGRQSLLIGDRAGEEYRAAVNDTQVIRDFAELGRAQVLTLLVDGHRLIDPMLRHQTRSEVLRLGQAVVDGGGARKGQRLAVTLTKLDEVVRPAHEQRVRDDFESLLLQLQSHLGAHFHSITPFEIAASPKSDSLPAGTGLAALLSFWMQSVEAAEQPVTAPARSERVFRRLPLPMERR